MLKALKIKTEKLCMAFLMDLFCNEEKFIYSNFQREIEFAFAEVFFYISEKGVALSDIVSKKEILSQNPLQADEKIENCKLSTEVEEKAIQCQIIGEELKIIDRIKNQEENKNSALSSFSKISNNSKDDVKIIDQINQKILDIKDVHLHNSKFPKLKPERKNKGNKISSLKKNEISKDNFENFLNIKKL